MPGNEPCIHRLKHSPVRDTEARFRAKREQLKWFDGLLPSSQGQNVALTVLYVPCSRRQRYRPGASQIRVPNVCCITNTSSKIACITCMNSKTACSTKMSSKTSSSASQTQIRCKQIQRARNLLSLTKGS